MFRNLYQVLMLFITIYTGNMNKYAYVNINEKGKGMHMWLYIQGNNPYHKSLTNLPTILWTP